MAKRHTTPPVAAFGQSAYSGSCNLPITVTMSAADPDGSIVSWTLQWGDKQKTFGTGSPTSATHTYPRANVYTATLTVVDSSGASASAKTKITIQCGTQPPPPPPPLILTVPANQTATTVGSSAVVTWSAPTTTGGNAPITIVAQPPSGSAFPIGVTTVQVMASSADGQHASGTFTVTVTLSPPPPPPPVLVVTCPPNQSGVSTDGNPVAVSFPAPTTTGGVGPVTVVANPASGSLFGVGVNTVVVTATSADGQAKTCRFTVTVTTPKLTITCPGTQTGTSTTGAGVVVTWAAPTTTGGISPVTVVSQPASGSTFPVGTTVVQATATSPDGQSATCQFLVVVSLIPTVSSVAVTGNNAITVGQTAQMTASATYSDGSTKDVTALATWMSGTPAHATISAGGLVTAVAAGTSLITATYTQAGTLTVTVSNAAVAPPDAPSSPVPANGATGISTSTSLSWISANQATAQVNFGPNSPPPEVAAAVVPTSYAPGPLLPGTTYFWQAIPTNVSGTTPGPIWSFTTAPAPPPPPPPPTLSVQCPQNLFASSPSGSAVVVTWPVPTTQGGTAPVVVTSNPASGSSFPVGVTTVQVSATSADGQAVSCSFTVTVTQPLPTLQVFCPPNQTAASPDGNPVAVSFPAPTVSGGAAHVLTLVVTPASGSLFPVGTTTVVATLTSAPDGRSATCSFKVTVTPPPPPPTLQITCPPNQQAISTDGNPVVVAYPSPVVTGGVLPYVVTGLPASGSLFPVGVTTVGITATSKDGQAVSCTFTVTVTKQVAPPPTLVVTCPGNQAANAPNGVPVPVTYPVATTSGGVAPVTIAYSQASGSNFPIGVTTVTVTAISTDGQTVTCTFTVTVTNTQGGGATPQTLPLVTSAMLSYLGGFRVPTTGAPAVLIPNGLSFRAPNGSNGPRGSLVIGGAFSLGEVEIPVLVANGDFTQMNTGILLQPWITNAIRNLTLPPPGGNYQDAGGIIYANRLIGAVYDSYDATGIQVLSHFYLDSLTFATAGAHGLYPVWNGHPQPPSGLNSSGLAGFTDGYFGLPNAAWASLLGPVFCGQQSVSIDTRTSHGPSIFQFDPANLGILTPCPATPLAYYPTNSSGAVVAPWPIPTRCSGASSLNQYFQFADDRAGGIVMAERSRSVLVLGRHGTGQNCYGDGTANAAIGCTLEPDGIDTFCYDPEGSPKGGHAYPYAYYVWAFDANDLLAVKNGTKNPWDVLPYSVWSLTVPNEPVVGSPFRNTHIDGATIDTATNILYIAQHSGEEGNFLFPPLIQAYQITGL